MQTIKLGILGAGKIAAVMAETVKRINHAGDLSVKLQAIGSRSLSKAQQFIKENDLLCTAYGSYDELVADPKIDLIYIATPHNFHKAHTLLALNHGKHVLVEKPFTVNSKEAEELFNKAKEKKLLVTEAIWTRYQPMRRIIEDELKSGIIGTPMHITANLGYNLASKERIVKPELAGGALLDLGVYVINFATMFMGHPENVEASCVKNALGIDMQDSISLTFAGGRMASLQATALAVTDRRGVIAGSNGFIEVDNVNNPERLRVYNTKYELVKTIERPTQHTGFEYELLETCDAIRKGHTECASMPHAETLYIMSLMDSIRAQFGIKYPFEH